MDFAGQESGQANGPARSGAKAGRARWQTLPAPGGLPHPSTGELSSLALHAGPFCAALASRSVACRYAVAFADYDATRPPDCRQVAGWPARPCFCAFAGCMAGSRFSPSRIEGAAARSLLGLRTPQPWAP
jgi:hypothetical protein